LGKKILTGTLAFLFGLSLTLSLLMTAVEIVIFNTDRFMAAYEREDISSVTGMDEDNLRKVTDRMLEYLRGGNDHLNLTAVIHGQSRLVFGEREILHMVDVKVLFTKAFRLRLICLVSAAVTGSVLVLLLRGKKALRWLSGGYLAGLAAVGAVLAVLGVIIVTDFSAAFIRFHTLFFTNDYWLLDPTHEVLIQMLPESFFNDIALAMVLWGGAGLLIPAAAAVIILVRTRGRKQA